MSDGRLRAVRLEAGLTQLQLAVRAGVSRQLVGAVEAGRHLPRVDAALALAAALGVDARSLFGAVHAPVDVVTGTPPGDGSLVRVGSVGETTVTSPAGVGRDGWDVADGEMEAGALRPFGHRAPGFVVAGCEPGLQVLERLLREEGMAAVAAATSSVGAIDALRAGRVHAAVVHGPDPSQTDATGVAEVERFRLARWRVGLAGPPGATAGWWQEALSGRVEVVQREQGASVQRTFEAVLDTPGTAISGPRVHTHLEAARRAGLLGIAGVTIEPAARALGAAFHPLEVHESQLWVARAWLGERAVTEALNAISGNRFQRRLAGVGGYDLTDCGSRAA